MIAVLWEQLRAGFLLSVGYRLSFVLSLVARWSALVWVYFLARLVPADRLLSPELREGYLAFALIGMATHQYLHFVLSAFPEKLREDQLAGRVPALLVTPAAPALALFGPVLWGFVERSAALGVSLVIIVFGFGVSLPRADGPSALLALLLMSAAVGGWGILSACYTLVFKRGDPLLWLSETLGFAFSGALFPIDLLPPWLRWIPAFYPQAHAIRAARLALLQGRGAPGLTSSLVMLALFGGALALLASAVLGLALRHVRRRGSLGFA